MFGGRRFGASVCAPVGLICRPRGGILLGALDHAWERYHGNVEALVKAGVTDENRSKVVASVRKHAPAREGGVTHEKRRLVEWLRAELARATGRRPRVPHRPRRARR